MVNTFTEHLYWYPIPHPELQMRLKDPFSLKTAEMTKRTNRPRKPRDEESSDEVSGKYIDVTGVRIVQFKLDSYLTWMGNWFNS